MITVTLPKTKQVVEFYDDMREAPIDQFQKFQSQIMQDSGMGSTIYDVDKRFVKLNTFLVNNKVQEAIDEIQNMRFGIFFMLDHVSTATVSLAYMVRSIAGQPVALDTDQQAQSVANTLVKGGMSHNDVTHLTNEVKKINDDIAAYFSDLVDEGATYEFYQKLVKRALLIAESVLEPREGIDNEIAQLNNWFLEQAAPQNFSSDSAENVLIRNENAFLDMCTTLEEFGVHQPHKLTVYRFYSKLRYYKKKHAKAAKKE